MKDIQKLLNISRIIFFVKKTAHENFKFTNIIQIPVCFCYNKQCTILKGDLIINDSFRKYGNK